MLRCLIDVMATLQAVPGCKASKQHAADRQHHSPELHAPACQGYAFPHLTRRLDIAGRHVTAHLSELLRRRGHSASAAAGPDAMRRLKERLCYVAADLAREQQVWSPAHIGKSWDETSMRSMPTRSARWVHKTHISTSHICVSDWEP